MAFGIPYMGSKNSIAEELIGTLPKGKRFVDLFGGGFAMSHCALLSKKYNQVLYNELNPLLVQTLKKAINGDYNYNKFKPKFITREDFNRLKNKDGYVKYIWSFSNSGNAYLFGKDTEKQKESIHNWCVFGVKDEFMNKYFYDIDLYIKTNDIKKRRLLFKTYIEKIFKNRKLNKKLSRIQQLEQLERLERLQTLEKLQQLEQLERLQTLEKLQQLEQLQITCGSYEDYVYKDGDVVYCDPPYEATANYNETKFDSKKFYDWLASRPYPVYFSSYKINDSRFKLIWARGKRSLMSGASNKFNYECLYTNQK